MSDDKLRSDKPLVKGGLEGAAPANPTNPTVTFERLDVNINSIVYFGIGLSAAVVFCWFVIWGTFVAFDASFAREKQSPFPLAKAERDRLPNGPRLEQVQKIADKVMTPYSADVSADAFKVEQAKSQAPDLLTYGWVDEKDGVVHVPIDVAVRLVARRYGKQDGKLPQAPNLPSPPMTTVDGGPATPPPPPPAPPRSEPRVDPKTDPVKPKAEEPKAEPVKPKADDKPKSEPVKPKTDDKAKADEKPKADDKPKGEPVKPKADDKPKEKPAPVKDEPKHKPDVKSPPANEKVQPDKAK